MLSTTLFGTNITCIMNASGCNCTEGYELDELASSFSGAIVSKSSTIAKRIGNPLPRFFQSEAGSINSMGVPNLGYKYYMSKSFEKPFIQSILPFNIEELELILTDLNTNKRIVEVNLSCPNIIGKSIVGYNMEQLELYIKKMNDMNLTNLIIGIKLPPYYEECRFEQVSEIILKYECVKFITVINSIVNGLLVDIKSMKPMIKPKGGYGGVGGRYCLPTALSNIRQFYNILGERIIIIGCGGVDSGETAFMHILCGASMVQVGSQLVKEGVGVFMRIGKELSDIMYDKGYKNINEFRGKLIVETH